MNNKQSIKILKKFFDKGVELIIFLLFNIYEKFFFNFSALFKLKKYLFILCHKIKILFFF